MRQGVSDAGVRDGQCGPRLSGSRAEHPIRISACSIDALRDTERGNEAQHARGEGCPEPQWYGYSSHYILLISTTLVLVMISSRSIHSFAGVPCPLGGLSPSVYGRTSAATLHRSVMAVDGGVP